MTDLEERLLAMLEQERQLNQLLLQALLPSDSNALDATASKTVTISGVPKSIGRVPWNTLKAKLEKKFRRLDGEESVSSTDEQHDAERDHGTKVTTEIGGESDPKVAGEET